MNEERDPQLVDLFARAAPAADDAAFNAAVEARLRHLRRARGAQRIAAVVAALVGAWWVSPHAITASVALGDGVAAFMGSPAGWGVSLLAGVWVLRRARG